MLKGGYNLILSSSSFEYLLKRYDAEIRFLIQRYSAELSADGFVNEDTVRLHNMLIEALNEAYDLLDRKMKEFVEVINYV